MAARLTTYLVVAIVATTLIAGFIVGAQRDDSDGPVDLIVHNAAVYTADGDGTMAEAIAVRGNQILRVGSDREITRLRRPQTTMIDARGAAVVPGFNDAHIRLADGGLTLRQVDLTGTRTLPDIQSRVMAWAEAHPDSEWINGRGWRGSSLGETPPDRHALDAAIADRPVFLLSADGSQAWLNTRALTLAGITKRTAAPAGGVIVKDPKTGEPTGILQGSATSLAAKLLPRATRDDRARAVRDAIAAAHREGITSIQDIGATADDIALYDELRRAGNLDLRVYAALAVDGAVDESILTRMSAIWKDYADDPLLKTGAAALTLDGPVASHAAAMLESADSAGSDAGTDVKIAADDLNRFVRLLDAAGWQVLTQAHGDRAVRMALDAYAHATRSNTTPQRGRRHRVEGVGFVDAVDLPRFGTQGVIASLQPAQAILASPRTSTDTPGVLVTTRAWPLGSLATRGARLTFGSGWPSGPLSPLAGIHAAVSRVGADGPQARAERVALAAAIDAYTVAAARASFDEQRKGSLAAGMLADFVVLSNDIFTAPPARLASTGVDITIFDGKIVYRKDAKGTN